ncbi:MAG: NnrU family protein [Rhodospirillales bacterium]
MDTMSETLTSLWLSTALFVGGHFVLSSGAVRPRLVAALGDGGFMIGYSLFAIATFIWMNMAFSRAPMVRLWVAGDWSWYLALAVMPVAAILLACGYLTPNPAAVGGQRVLSRPDPAPGIFKVTRHPVMWAIALWAVAHTIATGDAAAVIFFGGLALLAVVGMLHIELRRNRSGDDNWRRLVAVTSFVPFVAALQGRARISLSDIGWSRIAVGIAFYLILLYGHEAVIGISVVPR